MASVKLDLNIVAFIDSAGDIHLHCMYICSFNVHVEILVEICVLKKQLALLLICQRRSTDMQRKIVFLLKHQVDRSLFCTLIHLKDSKLIECLFISVLLV